MGCSKVIAKKKMSCTPTITGVIRARLEETMNVERAEREQRERKTEKEREKRERERID